MSDQQAIVAHPIGNPFDGELANPWPPGGPGAGERVAIFAIDVTAVDAGVESGAETRTFHITPVERATEGPIEAAHTDPQGVTVQWTGCGSGTVVRPVRTASDEVTCEVVPDDAGLVRTDG